MAEQMSTKKDIILPQQLILFFNRKSWWPAALTETKGHQNPWTQKALCADKFKAWTLPSPLGQHMGKGEIFFSPLGGMHGVNACSLNVTCGQCLYGLGGTAISTHKLFFTSKSLYYCKIISKNKKM